MNSNFDYTTRDFVTIRRELGTRAARALPEWRNTDPSDFMNLLIDLWAYVGDVMHYYIDRSAREAFLTTATQRESVLALANLYDYTPNNLTSARGTVTLRNTTNEDIFVPEGLVLTASYQSSVYYFYTTSSTTASANSTAAVQVREGVQYGNQPVVSFTASPYSNGTANQKFSLFHEGVDLSTLRVDVAEAAGGSTLRWRRVLRFADSSASDSVYTATTLADGTTLLQFGNGTNGRIPPTNLPIYASYTVSNGAAGNLPANTITAISSPGYVGLVVDASTVTSGGADAESVASMKASIPLAFRAQERAVTLTDFADMARGVPGVTKAVAEYSTGASTGGSVTVYVAPSLAADYTSLAASVSAIDVAQPLREQVRDTLTAVAMLGIGTVAVPATINLVSVHVRAQIEVDSGYVQALVYEDVLQAIDAYFAYENVSFGQIMSVGDLYRRILDVPGVRYAVITGFNSEDTNSLLGSGKFAIQSNRLPRKGTVIVTPTGGLSE